MMDGVSTWVPSPADASAGTAPSQTHSWKDGGSFSFRDVLDTLNPLQHIPVIGTLYRWITGDQPGNVARIVGDGIYGGPFGAAGGAFSIAFKEETGQDIGEMAVAMVAGPEKGQVKIGTATAPASAVGAAAPAAADTAENGDVAPAATTASTVATQAPIPLFRSLGAAPASTTPAAVAPMPLYKAPTTAVAPTAAAMSPAEQAFVNQNTTLQRSVYGRRAVSQDRPSTAPIPLHLTGPAVLQSGPRPLVAPAPVRPLMQPPTPAAPVPVSALPDNPPVDMSQRMMDALDKYARLQQQRGQLIDVNP
jgi:hypothetical protein